MRKKYYIAGGIGALIGICISFIIPLFISLITNDGQYYPVALEMETAYGNQLNAVSLQVVISMLYGMICGMASLIFLQESWSLTKQTLMHFIVMSLSTFIAAYTCYWMGHNVKSIFIYFVIFFAIYLFIWIAQYISIYMQIKEMNKKVH